MKSNAELQIGENMCENDGPHISEMFIDAKVSYILGNISISMVSDLPLCSLKHW